MDRETDVLNGGPDTLWTRLGLSRPELRAWALYDWANSAFQTTVITAVFPPFFATFAAAGLPAQTATTRFAWATTLAVTITAIGGPVLGLIADQRAIKKRLLAGFMIVGVIATALMALIGRGDWAIAAVLFVVANVAIASSFVFYDSLLPHIARPEELDRVSTAGYAIGYLGGGVLLLLNLAWILAPGLWGLPGTVAAIKLSFISVAVWWLAFSVPLLRIVPEPSARNADGTARVSPATTFVEAWRALLALRRLPNAFLMLVAFLLYNDGIQIGRAHV